MDHTVKIRRALVTVAIAFAATLTIPATANAATPIVPCGSDLDCFEKNPGVIGYGTEKFHNGAWIIVDGKAVHIQEDDARWDCTTMGNRSCGEFDPVNGIWMLNHFDAFGEYTYSTPRDGEWVNGELISHTALSEGE
jgi:hypothetical protein